MRQPTSAHAGQRLDLPRTQARLPGHGSRKIHSVESAAVVKEVREDRCELVDLHEAEGVTKLTMKLTFRDKAGRDHMTKHDGQEDSFDKMEDHLRSLLDQKATAAG